MSDSVTEIIERQRKLILQICRVSGLDLSGLAHAAGVAPSTFTRIRAAGSTNVLRGQTLDKLERVARQYGAYVVDRDAMTLRDSTGEEISTDEIGRAPRRTPQGERDFVGNAFATFNRAMIEGFLSVLVLTHRLLDPPINAGAPTCMVVVDKIVDDTSPKTLDRPAWLARDEGAYAIRVDCGSLEPVLLYGDFAYVTTKPGMRPGDIVLVGRNDGLATVAGIYRGRGADGLEIGLLTGNGETVPAGKIAYVHRIVGIQRA